MTNWHERKTKSLSNVPLWLEKAVEDFQTKFGIQSWSAAALEIMACYLNQEHHEWIRFGDSEFENQLMDGLEASEHDFLNDYLRELVAPPNHGGDRRSGSDASD